MWGIAARISGGFTRDHSLGMIMAQMTPPPPSRDLARITLAVLFLGLMIAADLWVLQPFITATLWATMVVVATWPLMLALQRRLGGRRWLAVTVMTGAMLLVFFVPLVLAVTTIVRLSLIHI